MTNYFSWFCRVLYDNRISAEHNNQVSFLNDVIKPILEFNGNRKIDDLSYLNYESKSASVKRASRLLNDESLTSIKKYLNGAVDINNPSSEIKRLQNGFEQILADNQANMVFNIDKIIVTIKESDVFASGISSVILERVQYELLLEKKGIDFLSELMFISILLLYRENVGYFKQKSDDLNINTIVNEYLRGNLLGDEIVISTPRILECRANFSESLSREIVVGGRTIRSNLLLAINYFDIYRVYDRNDLNFNNIYNKRVIGLETYSYGFTPLIFFRK